MSNQDVYQISDSEFIKIVSESPNIHQALKRMGLKAKGGNYKVLRERCLKLDIKYPIVKERKGLLARNNISDQSIIDSCQKSFSRQGSLRTLGLKPTNTNIKWIDSAIKRLHIDMSHWSGQGHLKGKTHNWAPKIPLKEILVKNSSYTSTYSLKSRLLKEGIITNECSRCKITSWQGENLSLHLDHINGIRNDHRLENLRLLCPNCHSLTPTYCGKNKGKH